MHHSSNSEMQQVTVTEIARSYMIAQLTLKYEGRSPRRLIFNRFQVAPEGKIQEIEVQGVGKPSNRFNAPNPSPGVCGREMVTPRKRKLSWCTMALEPHVLINSGC
ncbi:hypothetical protein TNCV_2786001 [Trichonephila clavipes]|nr:hypothetical protein TNCV_2786001 [Trichonephila clavipes]